MEGSRISLHLLFFLLIGQASHTSITQPQTTNAIYPTDITSITQEENDTSSSPTKATTGCLIKPQLGFIVVTCAGGLVLFLLVSTVILASQVCSLRRQARAPRPARSNVDLVSGAGYWDTEGGIVGPCDTSVMLEEVRLDGEEDEEQGEEEKEEREEEQAEGVRGQTGDARTTGEIAMQMQSSSSRDLCLEIPQDLENMPLVV
ncbi:uncharacterized protein LOC109905830 [Oncorhynchus kisutch]|uniref:uncharacterized protein LOC109905830 n=1 Tax=Oncorhynchus kisutch TaxID=8019 RepID=UPI00099F8691|nr:uncharacterized protein LOC109905830 [Oncorhynchus kisutch]